MLLLENISKVKFHTFKILTWRNVGVPIAREAAKSLCAIAVTHHVVCVLADCNFLQQQLGLLHITRLQSKRQHSDPQPSAGREHARQQKESSCLYICHQKGWDTWMWKLTFCPSTFLLPLALLIHRDCFNSSCKDMPKQRDGSFVLSSLSTETLQLKILLIRNILKRKWHKMHLQNLSKPRVWISFLWPILNDQF